MNKKTIACLTALFVLAGSVCFAQVTGGTISGSVIDSSGSAIAGAQIAVTNSETAIVRSVNANNVALWAAHKMRLRQLAQQFNMTVEARVNERTRIARELHAPPLGSHLAEPETTVAFDYI